VTDIRQVFGDLVRVETELWDAVDERLRTEVALPLSWFEPSWSSTSSLAAAAGTVIDVTPSPTVAAPISPPPQ